MSYWTKEQLEQMLEDVVNELDLSEATTAKYGPLGTPPADLVRLVLQQKDRAIRNLRAGFTEVQEMCKQPSQPNAGLSGAGRE